MIPKEKAIELVLKYNYLPFVNNGSDIDEWYRQKKIQSIRCALICVDEILDVLFQHYKIDYWKEVKKEIEKL